MATTEDKLSDFERFILESITEGFVLMASSPSDYEVEAFLESASYTWNL